MLPASLAMMAAQGRQICIVDVRYLEERQVGSCASPNPLDTEMEPLIIMRRTAL